MSELSEPLDHTAPPWRYGSDPATSQMPRPSIREWRTQVLSSQFCGKCESLHNEPEKMNLSTLLGSKSGAGDGLKVESHSPVVDGLRQRSTASFEGALSPPL